MSTYDALQAMNKIAADKSMNNLQTGRIVRERDNDVYDVVVMGDNTIEMPSLKPANANDVYKKDDSVFIGVPYGNEGLLRIINRSNIEIPDEKGHRFRTKALPDEGGTLYFSNPDSSSISVYSLSGEKLTDIQGFLNITSISAGSDGLIYYIQGFAGAGKISPDGNDTNLNLSPPGCFYAFYGLAVNPICLYIYAVGNSGRSDFSIARAAISNGLIEDNWRAITEETTFSEIKDCCGDGVNLYILGSN